MFIYEKRRAIFNGEELKPWSASESIAPTCTRSIWLGQDIVVKVGDVSDLANALNNSGSPFNKCQTTREIAIWKMLETSERDFFVELLDFGVVTKRGVFQDKEYPYLAQKRIRRKDIVEGFDQKAFLGAIKPLCEKYNIGDIYPNRQPFGVNWTLLKGCINPVIYDWGSYSPRPDFINRLRRLGW